MKKSSLDGIKMATSNNNIKLPLIKINNIRKTSKNILNKSKYIEEKKMPLMENKNIIIEEGINKNQKEQLKENINNIIHNGNNNQDILNQIIKKDKEKDKEKDKDKDKEKDKDKDILIRLYKTNLNTIENNNNKNQIIGTNTKLSYIKSNHRTNKSTSDIKYKGTILIPRITKEKLKLIKEKRMKRLSKEKEEKENSIQIMEELKNNINININLNKNNKDGYKTNYIFKIKQEKVSSTLEDSGIIDAYKNLMDNLYNNGWPEENIYEYSSTFIKEYEKQMKEKISKNKNENIDKFFENKKHIYNKNINGDNDKHNNSFINKYLKEKKGNQFIKTLDRSRSSLNIKKKNNCLQKKSELDSSIEKDKNKKFELFKIRKESKKANNNVKDNSIRDLNINDINRKVFQTIYKDKDKKSNNDRNNNSYSINQKLYYKMNLKKREDIQKSGNNNINNNKNNSTSRRTMINTSKKKNESNNKIKTDKLINKSFNNKK